MIVAQKNNMVRKDDSFTVSTHLEKHVFDLYGYIGTMCNFDGLKENPKGDANSA